MSDSLRIARAVAQGVLIGGVYAVVASLVLILTDATRVWPIVPCGFLTIAAAWFLGSTRPGGAR